MAIQLRFFTLVMRKAKVSDLYENEISLYESENFKKMENKVFVCDEYLVGISAMSIMGLENNISKLKSMGLKENEDFQIIDMFFTGPCGWVTTVFEKGTQFAYLKDTENKNFAKLAYLYLQV